MGQEDKTQIRTLIQGCASSFKASLDVASTYLEEELARFKNDSTRRIPKLPLRAHDSHQYLSLPTSRRYLDNIALPFKKQHGWPSNQPSSAKQQDWNTHPDENPAVGNTRVFFKDVSRIINKIQEARSWSSKVWEKLDEKTTNAEALQRCDKIAKTISSLIDCINKTDPAMLELNSALILEVFDQWALLDATCVSQHCLLGDYLPMFNPNLLDVLHLPDIGSMHRLRRVQKHIYNRLQKCAFRDKTLFSDGKSGFGTRFASSSSNLQSLYKKVIAEQERLSKQKSLEWTNACHEYDRLSNDYGALTCKCTFSRGGSVVQQCQRCSKKTRRDEMKIRTFENFLPDDHPTAMAVVFELDIPRCIAIYRTVTWNIAMSIAFPTLPSQTTNIKKLEVTPLGKFTRYSPNGSITLASDKKSFCQTHYKRARMKCDLFHVLLPLGSNFKLYDISRKLWIADLDMPLTLAHLCPIRVPACLRATVMQPVNHPQPNPQGPSSYEIVASRRECPPDMSVHEFEAFQRLMSGTSRRWLTMLVEMGCSNINFSREDTVVMFSHLAHQAGPMSNEAKAGSSPRNVCHTETLGVVHSFFLDDNFLDRLLQEIEKRIRSIENNWRETLLMELLITLLLRVQSLLPKGTPQKKLDSLLQFARCTTLAWTESLRGEVMNAKGGEASGQASMYAFRAAVLCRRTFAPLANDGNGQMTAQDLLVFLRASISMQQNLTVDITNLSSTNRGFLFRDTVMGHRLKKTVQQAAEHYPKKLDEAICYAIGLVCTQNELDQASKNPRFDKWTRQKSGSGLEWYSSKLHPADTGSQDGAISQHISVHLTLGHLLVNGETIGKLPDNIRDSVDVKEVFGNKYLLTYPSEIPGMSHRLATVVDNHIIHFGVCTRSVKILSVAPSGRIYQYVPRSVFVDEHNIYDLPRGLVDGCCHWLNRKSGQLEIRRNLTRWNIQPNDWTLDIQKRQAKRSGHVLVDPLSATAKTMSEIFYGFEDVQRLTIFQPMKDRGPLSVELRHLELSFFVNQHGNLECRELGAEVDADQDAGTLYGYRSMIVLRDVSDPSRRGIIAPLGALMWKRSGVHVSVETVLDSDVFSASLGKAYARFDIDTALGRLTCPPEPRLLYTKAQLHAFTSLCLPDPLTGRTGEEEALHTLFSGRLQPWVSLPFVCLQILQQINLLVPTRVYYPPDKRVLQVVRWDKNLPIGLQNDRYGRIIRGIVKKAMRLRLFEEPAGGENQDLDAMYQDWSDRHTSNLEARGEVQRMRYECPREDSEPSCQLQSHDGTYLSLGYVDTLNGKVPGGLDYGSSSVFQIVEMLQKKPKTFPLSQKTWATLSRWQNFGGYSSVWQTHLIPMSTLMNRSTLKEHWGSIVQMCRASPTTKASEVMFTLACLAFAPDSDMDAIRLLAVYTYLTGLRSIAPPMHPAYRDFVYKESISQMKLERVIETEYHSFSATAVHVTGRKNVAREVERQRVEHMTMCEQDARRLAKELIAKWPDIRSPEASGFQSTYINVDAASRQVRHLWECLQHNQDLSVYLEKVQGAVSSMVTYTPPPPESTTTKPRREFPALVAHNHQIPSLVGDLVRRTFVSDIPLPPQLDTRGDAANTKLHDAKYTEPKEYAELRRIVRPFVQSTEPLRCKYGRGLDASLDALESATRKAHISNGSASGHMQICETWKLSSLDQKNAYKLH